MTESLVVTWLDEYSGEKMWGHVINSAYCQVTGRWTLLAAGGDGKFHAVHAEGVEVGAVWALETAGDGDDEEDEYGG